MVRRTIGQLAKESGVSVETIRFYQRKGLIELPTKVRTSFREYPDETVQRVRFIRQAKTLGFTLTEINDLLQLSIQPTRPRQDVKQLAESKLSAIRQKIRDLQKIEIALANLVQECSGRGTIEGCPIIEAIVSKIDNST